MKLRPKNISAIGEYDYKIVFDDPGGQELIVRFHIEFGRGVPLVQPDPDIFMDGRANTKEITAAVMAFHHARSVGGDR